jgi:uncharacterized protein (TIGR03437 family)
VIGEFVDQIFFDDSLTDTVFAQAPYNTRRARDTRNPNDMVLTGTNNEAVVYAAVTQTAAGYAAVATIGVNLKSAAVAVPAISGVVNAASFADGIQPGSWVAIFGQNLAAATRTLAASDVVNGMLPTSLGRVTVNIDSQPAFAYYVSPGQVNVLAPADADRGAVQVTVTNSAGTSAAGVATLLDAAPAFFASFNTVAAVPAGPFKPGDVVELYGTGFGPTAPVVAAGTLFSGSAPVTGKVTVTIGGAPAAVSYAGMVGAGLYQVNVTVPSLANGTYPVVAQVAGVSTQSGVNLTVKS